jgi:hypothetical protein
MSLALLSRKGPACSDRARRLQTARDLSARDLLVILDALYTRAGEHCAAACRRTRSKRQVAKRSSAKRNSHREILTRKGIVTCHSSHG